MGTRVQPGPKPPRPLVRALVIGLCVSFFVNVASPYTESIGFSNFSWSYLPEGGAGPFLLLLAISALLWRFSRRLALTRRELLLIFVMGLVSNTTSIFLVYFWLSAIISPHYFASPENRWATDLIPHIRPGLIIPDRNNAVFWFYEGLPVGQRVPWRDLAGPMLNWLPLLAAVLLASYAMAAIFRRQWLDHEKLRYPLMQLPLELLPGPELTSRPVYRCASFWIGAAIPFTAASCFAVKHYAPSFPAITIDHLGSLSWPWVTVSPHFPQIPLCVNMLALGVGFFVPTDVLCSVWVMYVLVKIIEVGVLTRLGIDIGSAGMFVWGSAAASWQSFGGFLVLIAGTLYSARRHLRAYWQAALAGGGEDEELLSPRTALIVLGGSVLVMGGWLGYSGMPAHVIGLFVPLVMLLYLYLARVICQSGIFYLVPPQIAQNPPIYVFGPRGIGRDGMIALGLSYSWHGDVQTVLAALAAEAVQVQRRGGIAGRDMTWGVLLSVFAGLIVAPLGILSLGYRRGAITWPTWVFKGWGPNTYGQILGQINNPPSFDPRPLIFTLVGAVVMSGLTQLSHQFAWWPLHPLGFVVASSFTMYAVYLAFLIAWIVKLVVLRWGGVKTYRNCVPFFIGLMVGHYAGRAVSLTVSMLSERALA
ncbi:MAG: hypothetical protein FJX75_19400 [Armatimonadetes bacterium]|nr:hypothetical protein [Armatimonadota bacterium]